MSVVTEIDWKADFNTKVSPDLKNYLDAVVGKAMLGSGRNPSYRLAEITAKFAAAGTDKLPKAVVDRATNTKRLSVPLPPESRVSFLASLLPHLGHEAISNKIHTRDAWDTADNLKAAKEWVPEFIDPGLPERTWRAKVGFGPTALDLGATHFVGLLGLGDDAGELLDKPENAKRLGVWGYDRQATFDEIKNGDGLANTIFLMQAPASVPRPWIRGGGATAMVVPETNSFKPFNQRHDKTGDFGSQVLMSDGSVRFIRTGVSDEVFKALTTYKGGEAVGDLEEVAPKRDIAPRLKTPAPPVDPVPPPVVEKPKDPAPAAGGPEGPATAEQHIATSNNLKQMAIAWFVFLESNRAFPNNVRDKDGKSLLSCASRSCRTSSRATCISCSNSTSLGTRPTTSR